MRIGTLGAGHIGGTLGRRLAGVGHGVMPGVRDLAGHRAADASATVLPAGTLGEAAHSGEAVVVALPSAAARGVLGALDLAGTVVLDATNAFGGLPEGYAPAADAIRDRSGSERLAKVFDAAPREAIADPVYGGAPIETFVCGDQPRAEVVALRLARDVGFVPVDLGGLANAALSDSYARLWGVLALQRGYGRNFAFRMVTR